MMTTINLDQIAVALASETWLVEGPALLPGLPGPVRDHPPPQRLAANLDRVLLKEDLVCKRWTKVPVMSSHQLDRILLDADVPAPVRLSASCLVDQPSPRH